MSFAGHRPFIANAAIAGAAVERTRLAKGSSPVHVRLCQTFVLSPYLFLLHWDCIRQKKNPLSLICTTLSSLIVGEDRKD